MVLSFHSPHDGTDVQQKDTHTRPGSQITSKLMAGSPEIHARISLTTPEERQTEGAFCRFTGSRRVVKGSSSSLLEESLEKYLALR